MTCTHRPHSRLVPFAAALAVLALAPPLAAQTATVTYTYDAAGRLTQAQAPGQTHQYTFDAAGNILTEVVQASAFVATLSPPAAVAGAGGFTLQVDGVNFGSGAVVQWGGSARPTTLVNATRLTAAIAAADIASAGTTAVTVLNQGASGASNSVAFYVSAAGATVAAGQTAPVSVQTPAGTVTVTLAGVTSGGTVAAEQTTPSGTAPPGLSFVSSGSFEVSAPGVAFTGATVCFPYDPATVAAAGLAENTLMLLHQAVGATAWDDITTSRDPVNHVLCGRVTSFSPFVIAGATGEAASTRYFAEGAANAFFDARIALANPDPVAGANVVLRFLKMDATEAYRYVYVPAMGRRTVVVKSVADMATAEFSTEILSDLPVVAERTMTWDQSGYASHAESSTLAPSTLWYLAEGATHSNFDLFYTIENATGADAPIEVTYLRPSPAAALVKTYTVAAHSRMNIWVDQEDPELAATDVSAVIRSTAGVPLVVERAMYLNTPTTAFRAGHCGAGITAPATEWFLAEGATGDYFDLFVLIANPSDSDAAVTATFLLPDGRNVVKTYTVAAKSRFNIWVDLEDPLLSNTAVGTIVRSTNGVGIIVERAMWWPGPTPATWREAHNSAGVTYSGTAWVLAEGEDGGALNRETYIVIANTSAVAGQARVTVMLEDGGTVERTYALEPSSRFNVPVRSFFPEAVGRRFGALVESVGDSPVQIVVEHAIYGDAGGVSWSSGANALATRIR